MSAAWPNCAAATRAGAPHEILDPRDLKYCRNLCDCSWEEKDDPFRWRKPDSLCPLGAGRVAVDGLAAGWRRRCGGLFCWWLAILPAVPLALVVYFFAIRPAASPQEAG